MDRDLDRVSDLCVKAIVLWGLCYGNKNYTNEIKTQFCWLITYRDAEFADTISLLREISPIKILAGNKNSCGGGREHSLPPIAHSFLCSSIVLGSSLAS